LALLGAAAVALPSVSPAADLLWSPPEVAAGAVDSAAILAAELAAAGRTVVQAGAIAGLSLSGYDAVWVTLGVHPHARALTLAEGEQLRQYLLGGGTLCIEGGDIWGFDPLTPFHTVDGIVGVADGVGDLAAVEGVAATNGGDLTALAAPYLGENSFIDRLAADEPGSGVVLRRGGGGYAVGVLHIGALSGLGDFRLLGLSFEFGGWGGSHAVLLAAILDSLGLAPPCSLAPPTPPVCSVAAGATGISWQNLAPYTSIEVLRDGLALATLPAAATSYIDPAPPLGPHEYRLRARDGISCEALSGPCSVVIASEPRFRRGDVDGSATFDISDPILLLIALFGGGALPACPDAGDADDSGAIGIADPIVLLLALFQGGPPPPGSAACGTDPTPDALPACATTCSP